ncbi:MAG TPA: ABC transporter substrate-binding protein [Anaerolineales bacterium]|nr:ABC transporter substrate-binding protein [Anaerolineales bacterium]
MRRFQFIWGIILAAAMLLSACGGGLGSDPYVRVGWNGEPDTLNPGMALLEEAFTVFSLIYDTLYVLNLDGSYSLSLAESVDVSEDGKVWTFKIRDGVEFSDGTSLTAEDVAFTFNLYKNSEDFVYMPGYTTYFESIEATSKTEVVITLTEAIPNMESQLYGLYVLPKHIWEDMEDPASLELPISQLVGSGPFRLKEYVPGQYITLEAWGDHHDYSPKIGGVEFRMYSELTSMIEDFADKKLDVIENLPVDAVSALNGMSGVQVVAGPPSAPGVADIIFNQIDPQNCPLDSGGICSGHPALRDRNVRLAMAHAIDKQALIDEVKLGLADPGLTLIPKGLGSFYNSSIPDYEYDVSKANQILDEAGYRDTNGDGIREMPDGSRDLVFRLEWPDDVLYAREEAELLKVMWNQIGIGVTMMPADSGELTERCCPAFDYDIILWEWGSDPDPSFLLSVMLTDEIPSGYNESGYSNPAYDELFAKQATALEDEERRGIIWQMQNLVHKDVVYIIPFYTKAVQAYRSDTFRGWLTDDGSLDLTDPSSLGIVEPIEP